MMYNIRLNKIYDFVNNERSKIYKNNEKGSKFKYKMLQNCLLPIWVNY